MSKMTLDYIEKHHILEVDGKEYEIPQRTVEIEAKIKEHDETIEVYTEYENNMKMLEILFGEKAAKEMFPDVKTTNLDKLSKCVKMALAAYYSTLHAEKDEAISKTVKELKTVLKEINRAKESINKQIQ